MEFERIKFDSWILRSKLAEHKEIKTELIRLINEAKTKPQKAELDDYYNNHITRHDFDYGDDFDRPWVKYFEKYFRDFLLKAAREMGYGELRIITVWFQQYDKNSCHNWHVHSNNYSGVYYVDMPQGSAPTEFMSYPDRKKFINPGKEGDLIFFPCYIMHRTAPQEVEGRKTIISWNIDFEKIREDVVWTL